MSDTEGDNNTTTEALDDMSVDSGAHKQFIARRVTCIVHRYLR